MTNMLALSFLSNLIVALFVLLSVGLILIILLQKGRGGGLGAAFGGGGAGSLLGTKTGDFLTWVTIALVAGFLVLAVLMGKYMRPKSATSTLSAPMAPAAEKQDVAGESAEDTGTDMPASIDEATDTTVDEKAATEEPVESIPEPTAETATETTE